MRRSRAIACGDLNNGGDLLLLLQNLTIDGPRAIVRRWGALPSEIEAQVEAAGGMLRSGRRLLSFARECFGRDLVIGGGQLVRDNTALRSLAGLLLAALAARAGGGDVLTRGLGVSRLASPTRRMLWAGILRLARSVNVRDQTSQRNATLIAPHANVVRTADMAFLATDARERLFGGCNAGADRRGTVLAPCIDRSEGRTMDGSGLAALLAAATAAGLAPPVTVACHDPRPGMDRDAGARLIASHPGVPIAISPANGLPDLAVLYARAALVLTNRLHAMIMAAHAGTPVIALDKPEGKLAMQAAALGIAIVQPDLPLDADGATRLVHDAVSFNRAARAAAIAGLGEAAARNLQPAAA